MEKEIVVEKFCGGFKKLMFVIDSTDVHYDLISKIYFFPEYAKIFVNNDDAKYSNIMIQAYNKLLDKGFISNCKNNIHVSMKNDISTLVGCNTIKVIYDILYNIINNNIINNKCMMEEVKFSLLVYEKYKIYWLMTHNYTLGDIIERVLNLDISPGTSAIYIESLIFGDNRYPSYDKFYMNEYQREDIMQNILVSREFETWENYRKQKMVD